MKDFKVSVITVVYNSKEFLKKTLESVINQDYPHLEYIIIDGASDDGSIKLIEELSDGIDIFISEKDNGIYDAMNKGLNLASGEWIIFLNAGDYFYHTTTVSHIFNQDRSSLKMMYGSMVLSGIGNKVLAPKPFTKWNLILWGTRVVCHQSLFVKKEIAPRYDTKFRLKSELDWYFQLVRKVGRNEFRIINEPICFYQPGGMGDRKLSLNLFEQFQVLLRHAGLLALLSLPVMCYKLIIIKTFCK